MGTSKRTEDKTMTHYEMAEKLSEKMGVSLEKATEALEACDW